MLARVIAAVVLLCAGSWGALAQEVPVMGSSGGAEAVSSEAGGEPGDMRHILVIGDAIGGGLGAGLQRMAEQQGSYDVTIRFNEESGFARPEVYDWAATIPKIVEGKDYDIIVVLIGSNDRQQIRAGNSRLAFNSPDWIAAYTAQLDKVLDALHATGARIYWIGQPPMANAGYDEAMRTVSALQKDRAEAKGAVYLDMRPFFASADGNYADSGPDDTGTVRRLRGRDGISFFKQGNNRMGQIVLEALAGGIAAAARPREAAEPAASAVEPPEADVPYFGQDMLLGEALILRPKDVVAALLIALGNGETAMPPSAAIAALLAAAQPGSAAARLFATGEVAPAPAGRLDDFAAPAPPP